MKTRGGRPKLQVVQIEEEVHEEPAEKGNEETTVVEIGVEPVEAQDISQETEEEGTFKKFGHDACPECGVTQCSRPVKECCGHVKCRQCFITNDEGCKQCVGKSDAEEKEKEGEGGEEMEEEDGIEEGEGVEVVEELCIEPSSGEYVLELEQSSGGKSLAFVSADTLRQLGINSEAHEGHSSISAHPVPVPTSSTSTKRRVSKKGNRAKVWDHILTLDTDPKKYQCSKCSKEFDKEYLRQFHLYCNPANGRRPFVCNVCSKEFVSRSHYEYHERSHTGEKPFECPTCKRRFIQKVKLNRHMASHDTGKNLQNRPYFVCVYCKKRFNNLSNCKKHLQTHTDEKPFECTTCPKAFRNKDALNAHTKTHLNERPHKCTDCDKAFSTAKDLRRHTLTHTGELPFECVLCTTRFRRKDNLERHIRKTHNLSEQITKMMSKEAIEKYNNSMNPNEPKPVEKKGAIAKVDNEIETMIEFLTG